MAERGFGAHLASVELPAGDPDALATFYRAVFGWRSGDAARSGSWRPLTAPDASSRGAAAAVTTPAELGADQPVPVIAVTASDLDAVLAAVVGAGGRAEGRVRRVGDHGSFGLFRDPAGNLLGLWAPGGGAG